MGATIGNPYDILGVSENADNKQLRNAFLDHIHALKAGLVSSRRFRLICRAYECLSDDETRKLYDEQKCWIPKIPIKCYTLQQLASEPSLIDVLKDRLNNSTLRDINAQDPRTGHTALYCAARVGNLPGVKCLIEMGAETDLLQRTQSTALHVSSFYGHPEVVRCLLESGADYRIVNLFGSTAESEAYNSSVTKMFEELKETPFVQAAADQLDWFKRNIYQMHQHIDEQYYLNRQTLLHCASRKGYFDLVRWLVETRSANLDIVDINLNSALHLAAYSGHENIVEYLLEQGANSSLVNKWKFTAEQEGEHYDLVIKKIFENMRNKNIFEMAKKGIDWWFEYHLNNRSPDSVDNNGTSLLYTACRYGQIKVARWLLKHGANVNMQLEQGSKSTPLHVAAYYGYGSIVELLLAHGADVNIKNSFGATVFDEVHSEEIKNILEQHRHNLKNVQLMPAYIYAEKSNGIDSDEPIAKVHLCYDATEKDLVRALPNEYQNKNVYFSIARRPLVFRDNETTIVSAINCTRYVNSQFVEVPICLTVSCGHPTIKRGLPREFKRNLCSTNFLTYFGSNGQNYTIELDPCHRDDQQYTIGDLSFSILPGSYKDHVVMSIKYLNLTESKFYESFGCAYLFRIQYLSRTRLTEPPLIHFPSNFNLRLYSLASPSSCWITSATYARRLPMVEGTYGLFRSIDIIPQLLSVPADMFLAKTIDKPLLVKEYPIPCKYLELRQHDVEHFSQAAYHGTRIGVIRSILMDGLVTPGTLVTNGMRVKPPANHIPLYKNVNNISNFANAIFVSPSIHYSSDPVYASAFEHEGTQLLPILQCSVRNDSYTTHRSTIPNYIPHPHDDINNIEWRITDMNNIEINAILFVIKEYTERRKQ